MASEFWYPAAPVSFLSRGPATTQVLSSHFLIWPQADASFRVFIDRCCHRAYPISKGHFEAGLVTCGYHGWKFNQEGACVHIPSESSDRKIPDTCKLEQVSSKVHEGYLWVWMGEGKPSELRDSGQQPHFGFRQGRGHLKCSALRALENAFDFSHVPFAHEQHPGISKTQKKRETQDVVVELQTFANGCRWRSPAGEQTPTQENQQFSAEFRIPASIYLKMPQAQGPSRHMIIHVTELSQNECRFDWSFEDSSLPNGTWHPSSVEDSVLREDRNILESIEKTLASGPAFQEHSVEADQPSLLLREIFQNAHSTSGSPMPLSPASRLLTVRMNHEPK